MAQHSWRFDGTQGKDFPEHGLTDENGEPHATVMPGDVVFTNTVEPTGSEPEFTRLDKPKSRQTDDTSAASEPASSEETQ